MSTAPVLAETQTLRNADLSDLAGVLRAQADSRYDVVVSADNLRYANGRFVVKGGGVRFDDDGVESADVSLRPTGVCEEHVASRFDIPVRYLRRIREQGLRTPGSFADESTLSVPVHELLLDETVNAHLAAEPARKFLLRGFRTDDPDAEGVARAFLSDRYAAIDNLDVLMAALDGVSKAGVNVTIDGCDLSERRMQVRVSAPEVQALAPVLLHNYRSPFGNGGLERVRDLAANEGLGYAPGGEPIVFAGFVIGNSETGGGAFTLTPRIILQICKNGLTVNADAMREIHLGGKLDEGIIRWSAETQRKAIDLITAKATDAVATFLDADYLAKVIARIEEKADASVKEPTKVLERVAKAFSFSQGEQDTILSAFISSGDATAGGVMNAVTAAAQTIADPDRAADLEGVALDVLDLVAAA